MSKRLQRHQRAARSIEGAMNNLERAMKEGPETGKDNWRTWRGDYLRFAAINIVEAIALTRTPKEMKEWNGLPPAFSMPTEASK